jgi:short-subunit dehydrogenase
MRELFETWGDIDILVNNVGISTFKPLTELSIEEFDEVPLVLALSDAR